MATRDSKFRRQVNNHVITWSTRESRYIIKNPKGKRVYAAEYLDDAVRWVKRNS